MFSRFPQRPYRDTVARFTDSLSIYPRALAIAIGSHSEAIESANWRPLQTATDIPSYVPQTEPRPCSPDTEEELLRIAQEAANNAASRNVAVVGAASEGDTNAAKGSKRRWKHPKTRGPS
jgi:hypothetical protein